MATLQELMAQKAALEQQIEEQRLAMRAETVVKIKAMMAESGVTIDDLSDRAARKVRSVTVGAAKVAAKYVNKETGEAWSGRGLQPRWLKAKLAAGATLDQFAVVGRDSG